MALPMVFISPPASSLFQFPPHSEPQTIPPPHFEFPFTIPDGLYVRALDPKVPITIAAIYAVTAKALNVYNRSTDRRPWAISKTKAFHAFVVLHNVFLAVYSAWTWFGMLNALRNTIVGPAGPEGWAGTVDSFCKFHGPPGLGNAISYSQSQGTWESITGTPSLTSEGSPSRADTGRLWNEGLAFYGWLFYVSKFYEVIDTLIILAKGKFSSTLQTYHHAGAMMAMWAGMRYMATPIWIFVFFNSAIHALMYTYFTVTAFNIRVPTIIKRSLTSLQISQFIIGASCAMIHSFISYLVPIQVKVSPAEATAAVSAAASASPLATNFFDSFKQVVFGAAEAAGMAAVVSSPNTISTQPGASYITRYQKVDCITTSGATFAIWLNVIYLAPLTYLFVSFFIASYLRRSKAEVVRAKSNPDRRRSNVMLAEKASWDAAKGIEREVYGESKDGATVIEDSDDSSNNDRLHPSSAARVNGHVNGKANGKKH
ncbi:GNS1/SUR4 family-domain-containing protein [Hypoxylon trugodes]|uniref:GNS1/SUR4 family-domain-containing protein n=1 Tax=Hypoxylon trugodes TaxID=326681 RepID=UPI00219AACE9|nr:GNS1/SUR4 family-domain-containing protein [Hypoxylon trugodes]KAI1393695.1 GNS1/SUR4 family-domain-containing protein [Hypoxylon trugodes]